MSGQLNVFCTHLFLLQKWAKKNIERGQLTILLCFISYNQINVFVFLSYFLLFSVSNIKRSHLPRVRTFSHTTSCTQAATIQRLVAPRYTVVQTGLPSKWLNLIALLYVLFSKTGCLRYKIMVLSEAKDILIAYCQKT